MKLVTGCCATLLAFALIAPTADAAWPWPPKPPKPRDTTPPTVPTGLRVVSATDDSVTVRWNASTDNSGRILRYQVNGIYHDGASTQKTITGLVPNWTLAVRVVAVDPSENYSAQSEPLMATTAPDVIAPTTPGNLRLTATISPSSISLAWDRSTDRWAFTYEILMNGELFARASSTSTRLRHIPRNSTNTFTVRARDTAGNVSGVSNAIVVTQPPSDDGTAPTAPTNLTAEDLDDFCGSVILRWGQSTDNADPQSAIEYEIYRNGVLFLLATGTGIKGIYAGEGLATWTLVAVDRSGNSSPASNPVTTNVFTDQSQC